MQLQVRYQFYVSVGCPLFCHVNDTVPKKGSIMVFLTGKTICRKALERGAYMVLKLLSINTPKSMKGVKTFKGAMRLKWRINVCARSMVSIHCAFPSRWLRCFLLLLFGLWFPCCFCSSSLSENLKAWLLRYSLKYLPSYEIVGYDRVFHKFARNYSKNYPAFRSL